MLLVLASQAVSRDVESLIVQSSKDPPAGHHRDGSAAICGHFGAQSRGSDTVILNLPTRLFVSAGPSRLVTSLADAGLPVLRFLYSRCLSPNPSSTHLDIRPVRPVFTREVESKLDKPVGRLTPYSTPGILHIVASFLLGRSCTAPRFSRHKIQVLPLILNQLACGTPDWHLSISEPQCFDG